MAWPKGVEVTRKTARRLAITKQHLSGKPKANPGAKDIFNLVKDMSYLQLDPTNAVAPSHLLVLWSRLGAYDQKDLDRLLWKDKTLFEYWAHMASIVLTQDYPIYEPRMKQFINPNSIWAERVDRWLAKNQGLKKYILAELGARGPLLTRQLEDRSEIPWERERKKWGLKETDVKWSTGHSAARMVEMMFHRGEVLVAGREGRQKLWDLPERVLPPWTPRTKMTGDEVEYIGAQKSLKGLGVGTMKQIEFHYLLWRYPHKKSTVQRLVEDGKFVPVNMTDASGSKGQWFVHVDDLRALEKVQSGDFEPRTTLLSPFDNLISDRDRTHLLFDFFFRIEIYTPKEKRIHGFFVLPILDGDRIVGRVDPTMDREHERLVINAVHAEPSAPKDRGLARRISDSVEDLADFLGAKEVDYPGKVPEAWKSALK